MQCLANGSSLAFHCAGVPAEQGIWRAPADESGGQRHDANSVPQTGRARGGQSDQDQADGDTNNAVNAADIRFHG